MLLAQLLVDVELVACAVKGHVTGHVQHGTVQSLCGLKCVNVKVKMSLSGVTTVCVIMICNKASITKCKQKLMTSKNIINYCYKYDDFYILMITTSENVDE